MNIKFLIKSILVRVSILQKENGEGDMKKAIVVDANDVKKILAEHFHVSEENIIKSQYSFTIIIESEETEKNESKS